MSIKQAQIPAHMEGPPIAGPFPINWVGDLAPIGNRDCPERVAIVYAERGERLTYRQLESRSNAFVALALSHGLKTGDRVAYLGRNNDLFVPVLLGAIRGRFVLVPLNWRLTATELAYQIKDSETRLLIFDADFAATARDACAEAAVDIPRIQTEDANNIETADSLRGLLNRDTPPISVPHDFDQPIMQLYTSGTTGKPKGVLVSHGAFSTARRMEFSSPELAHLTPQSVLLSPMPNSHIGGISWMTMGLIRLGTVVLTADPSPGNLLRLLREHAIEHTFIVPTVIRAIVDELGTSDASNLKLRGLYYGAMPMGEGLLRESLAKFNCKFLHYFGMTEVSGSATMLGPGDHDLARPHLLKSIGKPYPGMQIEIRGPNRELLPRGTPGEIWIRTPTLMLGYSKQPEKTREAVVDGWYATGDGAYMDADGWLYLTDRIKDMIVSGGENVYPAEVEEAMRTHAAVLDAAVVALPDSRWGEIVTAMVQLRPGKTVTEDELRAAAKVKIASFKVPKRIFFCDALPRTAAGKVQRVEVRRMVREQAAI